MLKRLELVGFKSFADKTQFDFAPGITAIVGPNGSGKSNVVDGIRWLLGEQSAKSLRGGEMADVIFNGSTTRKSLGLAEVTMSLVNTKRQFNLDAEEIHVTRRVYRSGEGEYLINHQLCRLKDIKDLFLGSGAGNHSYSIIEQGRVDVLLQASTKERRIIFEEAAGISRFKARKIETLRKLERVDQNLQRLRDIIDEVNKQLRSVKLAAAKAERYKEYSKRLQELRVGLGLQEYHQVTEKLNGVTGVLDALRAEIAARSGETESWDTDLRRFDETLTGIDENIHTQESRLAAARQQIATADTTLAHERNLAANLEKELSSQRISLTDLTSRMSGLIEAVAEASRELTGVETECHRQRLRVQGMEDAEQSTRNRLAVLNRQVQADKTEQFELMRQSARLQNEVVGRKAHMQNLLRERDRLRLRGDQAAEHLASIDVELQSLTDAEQQLANRLSTARQSLTDHTQQRDRFRQMGEAATAVISDLKAQRSGLASRIEVLDALERGHEGLGTGVREMYALLEQPDPGPWRTVLGMVADFLTVPREHAPLIDLALGDAAQRFLVRDMDQLQSALIGSPQPFASRVSFISTDTTPKPTEGPPWASLSDIALRAVDLVTCDHPELRSLPAQLLARTLIVNDLETARRLASQMPDAQFVTRQGEVLEADGTLTVGTANAGTGILSRKSELRELRIQAEELEQRIEATEHDLVGLRKHEGSLESEIAAIQEEITVVNEQVADLRSRIGQHQERRAGLHMEVETSRTEISGIEGEIGGITAGVQQAQNQADEAERNVQAVQDRLEQADREIRDKEQIRDQQQAEREAARVLLAQVEERLKALRARHAQMDAELTQRRQERQLSEQHLATARARWEESQRIMLQAQSDLARAYLDKETAHRLMSQLAANREAQRQQRHLLAEKLQAAQSAWRAQQEQAHTQELEASTLRNRRDNLAARLREDYQLELEALYKECQAHGGPSVGFAEDPEAANNEIEELKRKLSRLGSVNLEALQELVDLETRSKELQTQHDDLASSQKALLEIINQINLDSRKLFSEAFNTIRGHFQELFRKLFGGGMADIVLEDENDILECGIEIIARPPGKELRSISLMSGGEKTMTAVALLLAIFRSKPSPFCILDEVDAALDEANIGRFSSVLREFLDLSQFIIVTHSKKTMSMADVLYGVTMQESGISKRVAVKFEDFPNEQKNGETKPSSLADGERESFAGR
jgi:chromosome segregation protein